MGEDRALDEFLGTDDGDGADDGDDGDAERGDEVAVDDGVSVDDGAADPGDESAGAAVSTTAFAPEGAACESCGASVRRRWRDDGALVCADCKAW